MTTCCVNSSSDHPLSLVGLPLTVLVCRPPQRHSMAISSLSERFGALIAKTDVAAWRSGNGVGRINVRRARLVLGWVTCPGSTPRGGTLFQYVTSQPGRLSLSSFRG